MVIRVVCATFAETDGSIVNLKAFAAKRLKDHKDQRGNGYSDSLCSKLLNTFYRRPQLHRTVRLGRLEPSNVYALGALLSEVERGFYWKLRNAHCKMDIEIWRRLYMREARRRSNVAMEDCPRLLHTRL